MADYHYLENRWHRLYQDSEGVWRDSILLERYNTSGLPQGVSRFHGTVTVEVPTPMGTADQTFRFDVPGADVAEAWQNFDDAIQAATTRGREHMAREIDKRMHPKPKLVVPNEAQARKLTLVADTGGTP